jgi:hypothetical protein
MLEVLIKTRKTGMAGNTRKRHLLVRIKTDLVIEKGPEH